MNNKLKLFSRLPTVNEQPTTVDFSRVQLQLEEVINPLVRESSNHIQDTSIHFTEASIHHGSIAGLTDDDHSQYALLAGRVGGQTIYGGTASGDTFKLRSTSHATKGKLYLNSTDLIVVDDTNASVGMGTAVPKVRLHLRPLNNIASVPTLGTPGGPLLVGNSDDNYGMLLGSNNDGHGFIQQQRVDGTATAYNLLLQPVGGNVGVGTPSPGEKLDVVGHIRAGDGTSEARIIANGAAGSYRGFEFRSANVGRWWLAANNSVESGSNAGSDLQLHRYADNGNYLGTPVTINRSTGYLGLNTNDPLAKVHVAGGSVVPVAELGSFLVTGDTIAKRLAMGVDCSSTMYSWIQSVENGIAARSLCLQPLGGLVSIGNAAPGDTFHITRNASASRTGIIVENLDQRLKLNAFYQAGVDQYSVIQSSQDNGSAIKLLLNPDGGNVGVGTTTPAYSDTVAGRTTLTVKGSTNAGVLETAGGASDADGSAIGIIQATDIHSVAADRRACAIVFAQSGTTATNRGGRISIYTKANGASGLSNTHITCTPDGKTAVVQEAWTGVTFQNSWANYNAAYADCSYMKDSQGFVHIRGVIKNGSAWNAVIFQLPAGYRPAQHEGFPAILADTFSILTVNSNGNVYFTTAGSTSTVSACVNGITFRAA